MLDNTKRVRRLPAPLRPWEAPTKRIDLFQLEMQLDASRRSAAQDDFDLRPTTQYRAVEPQLPTAPPPQRIPLAVALAAALASALLVLFASACGVDTYEATEPSPPGGDPDAVDRGEYFCPAQHVTRRETARYLEKLMRGVAFAPPAASNLFHDVERSSADAAWVEQLFRDGITRGYSPTFFAPEVPVSREQMAAFLVRALRGKEFTRGGTSRFADVTNPDFVGYIEQIVDDGIMTSCSPTQFCPTAKVTRAELAAVLVRAARAQPAQVARRFADVASDHPSAAQIEKAVADGLLEACDKTLAPPALRESLPGFTGVAANRPREALVGWLPDTTNYGTYVVEVHKRWWSDMQRDYCGGDYGVTLGVDIGEVSFKGIYVRSVTFATRSTKHVAQPAQIALDGKFYPSSADGLDANGVPYRTFRVDAWLGSTLELAHVFVPHDAYDWTGELTDEVDPTWCAMSLQQRLIRP